jgi:hypothetical protein
MVSNRQRRLDHRIGIEVLLVGDGKKLFSNRHSVAEANLLVIIKKNGFESILLVR